MNTINRRKVNAVEAHIAKLQPMRISVNPNGHFGFIRSLFLLLFRPYQFYLK